MNICVFLSKTIESLSGMQVSKKDYDTSLEELGINSLLFVHLVIQIESEFKIEIPDKYLVVESMDTINKIKNVIEKIQ
jgi:acyl carrier protein